MGLTIARFLSLLFVTLTMAPSAAHFLELPNKIHLSHDDYLTVQQIYRGWAWLGVVVISALLSTLTLTALVRKRPKTFTLALAAFLCLVGAQAVFWLFTFPTNQATSNWTMLPENWESLRIRWEYSHAAGAVLNLAALVTLICSTLVEEPQS